MKRRSVTRRSNAIDNRVLRIMPWWWAAIATPTSIVLGVLCWLVVWSIAGHSAALRIEAIKVGLSVSAGAGAACALLLAFRRQLHNEYVARDTSFDAVQRRVNELYAKAVEQLGNEKAAVRLGGLYALERLAPGNAEFRQTVVDVVCAYLRMSFDPADVEQREELQVRLAAQRMLKAHFDNPELSLKPDPNWGALTVDLRGAQLVDANFSECLFDDIDFSNATFTGTAWLYGISFNGASAIFEGTQFCGDAMCSGIAAEEASVSFDRAHFQGKAHFAGSELGSDATFDGTRFEGEADFDEVDFSGLASFENTQFNAEVKFREAHFNSLKFDRVSFGLFEPDFTGATVRKDHQKIAWPEPWEVKPSADQEADQLVRRGE